MPKDQYDTDLYMASDDDTIDSVFIVGTGENEGEFLFQFHPQNGEPSMISTIIVDLPKYPTGHEVFVFGCGEDATVVGERLSDMPSLAGKSVKQILTNVSRHLRSKEADGSATSPFIIDDEDTTMRDAPAPLSTRSRRRGARDTSPMMIDDQEDLYSTSPTVNKGKKPAASLPTVTIPVNRLVSDLRAVKDAGFKLGYHGSLKGSGVCYVIVSCRLSRLGLSDNALDAWHVESKRYLSLIIEYPAGYANITELTEDKKRSYRTNSKKSNIRMRIRQGDKYKPTRAECQNIFKRNDGNKAMPYIFQSLELFINERLVNLVKNRLEMGFSWYGAEEYYFSSKKTSASSSLEAMETKFYHDDNHLGGFSRLVTSDHIIDSTDAKPASFPLVAMQFLLRNFAKYTEYCLVCHRRVKSDVEALEPYVCSTPECLSKYLSSDFGPGIERDIVEQPYVVDLLVSFCYAASRHQKLKTFPDALNLKVPFPPSTGGAGYTGTFDRVKKELTLRINAVNPISHPVQVGSWMTISGAGSGGETLCCRAVDMSLFPIIKVSDPVSTTAQASAVNMGSAYTGQSAVVAGAQQVVVNLFNQDLAAFTPQQKMESICLLLDTLPSVREMKDRLREGHLSSWGDRISPAALGVLRWVVASNRACIVQVDGLETGSNGVFPATHTEDRVYGMGNWMQFRFAMGAPDKEQRFQTATSGVSRRIRNRYPTLFAWHGSPLANWHSIIREGLNFDQTLNGRAYGNGCYHSLDFRTSLGYTANRYAAAGGDQWSKSVLKVSAAVALNEIVNSPGEFVSRSPHLVVAQLDWICTRYLFVQCAFSNTTTASQKQPAQIKPQDPSMTPNGEQGKIIIPQPKAARARKDESLEASKGKKGEPEYMVITIDGIEERIPVAEDPASDATNDSDLDVFFEEISRTTAPVVESTEISDLDVAIALSMEESLRSPYEPAPTPLAYEPPRTRRRTSIFSGFGGGRGRVPENRLPSGGASTTTSAPLPPSYDDIPMITTPPGYTPMVDVTSTSSTNPFVTSTPSAASTNPFFTNATTPATAATAEPPRYLLRSGVDSTPTAASSSSAGASNTRQSGFFGNIKKSISSIGTPTSTDSWNTAFSALPLSNSISSFGVTPTNKKTPGKGRAPVAQAPLVISAPILQGPLFPSLPVATAPAPVPVAAPVTAAPVAAPVVAVPVAAPIASVPAPVVTAPPVKAPVVKPPPTVKAPVVSAPAVTATSASATISVPVAPAPKKPEPPKTDFVAGELDYSTLPLIAQPTFATHQATKRLQKEYKNLLKIQDSTPLHELGWYTNPDHFDNVYQWIVELHTFDSTLPLAQDMKSRGIKSVVLELRFGASFPTTPPFVRVIKPRFLPFMSGGGGHVTIGGAVCLEMLTGTGWDSKTTIESILLNVRLAMMSLDPKPARLEYEGVRGGPQSTYNVPEAVQAYLRACRTHGWAVPKGFEQMASATA
ncbi:hypothetical protein H072_5212 [Dactylellina haptotyla CBS 200.50]|uniref:UBC core domain-containing protein n=1 Tax=Dactylellina haptotyla (strain CBS 200.50) TaxID=1284197 RepID=S8BN88_DACHA|nr:hypothetical protein H072_5212 [Dactylellina haptotyla CBS 200.50]